MSVVDVEVTRAAEQLAAAWVLAGGIVQTPEQLLDVSLGEVLRRCFANGIGLLLVTDRREPLRLGRS